MVVGREDRNSLKVSFMRGVKVKISCFFSDLRLNKSICLTRSTPRIADLESRQDYYGYQFPGRSKRARSELITIAARMLLKSWAIPPVSVPIASSF